MQHLTPSLLAQLPAETREACWGLLQQVAKGPWLAAHCWRCAQIKTYVRVVFSKSTWLKGTIEKHTLAQVKDSQADFIVKAGQATGVHLSPFQVSVRISTLLMGQVNCTSAGQERTQLGKMPMSSSATSAVHPKQLCVVVLSCSCQLLLFTRA